MTTLTLPPPPAGVQSLPGAQVGPLAEWLLHVARKCGEPALDHALSAGWPGTAQQRQNIEPHVESARNEARQVASESWAKEAKKRGEWGV